jgi:triosephosphate isomerase
MRKPFVAGNWKMNMDRGGSVELASDVARAVSGLDAVDVAVCPPSVYLHAVAEALAGTRVDLGGQNAYFESKGAYTGEVSMAMLKDVGCRYVILGHSERRHVFGETDGLIAKKVRAALAGGPEVILCVGELIEERRADKTEAVLDRQIRSALKDVSPEDMARVVVAYEPVWAIGTGETASPDQAQDAHRFIRELIQQLFDESVAQALRIQYGGSVKPNNADELLAQPDVDGALVGGASLEADKFAAIVKAGEPA